MPGLFSSWTSSLPAFSLLFEAPFSISSSLALLPSRLCVPSFLAPSPSSFPKQTPRSYPLPRFLPLSSLPLPGFNSARAGRRLAHIETLPSLLCIISFLPAKEEDAGTEEEDSGTEEEEDATKEEEEDGAMTAREVQVEDEEAERQAALARDRA
eukprot:3642537-Rhodomonas_salina.2